MARKSNVDMERIIKLIEKIAQENHTVSPAIIGKIAKEQYNENISNKTLIKYCSTLVTTGDMMPNSNSDIDYENDPQIQEINSRMAVLKEDFKNAKTVQDKCKISGQIDSTQESKAKIKKILREAEQIKKNSDKAQYIVKFGDPVEIDTVELKKPFFKTDEKQKSLPTEVPIPIIDSELKKLKKEGDEKNE